MFNSKYSLPSSLCLCASVVGLFSIHGGIDDVRNRTRCSSAWTSARSRPRSPVRPVSATCTPTAVGWPKDHIARTMLGRDVVFGQDLTDHRLALDVIRPFEKGVLKYGDPATSGLDATSRSRSTRSRRGSSSSTRSTS